MHGDWKIFRVIILLCGISAALMIRAEMLEESELMAVVMVDSECGDYRSSGKASEFYWAIFGSTHVKAAAKPSPARGDDYDYEFWVQYYPASCEHTLFLLDPLGREKVRTRTIDTKIWIVEDEFPLFDTTYDVARRLIALWREGARMRW